MEIASVFVHALIDRKLKPHFPIREAILRGFIRLESELHLPPNSIR
jgi:hypothetical protein